MQRTIHEFDRLRHFVDAGERTQPHPVAGSPGEDRTPLVGIIRNPRSHRNKGHTPELADRPHILTQTPRTKPALRVALGEFARRGIEYLVVDGGDGTVRDVLTCGADIYGDAWPRLIVLPKGKTNALTVDLGLPTHWSLAEALQAAERGRTVARAPLRIVAPDTDEGPVQGFLLGAGVFTMGTQAGQEVHRWGAFSSFAVGLTIGWATLQVLFAGAGNPWRSGTPMRLRTLPEGREIPHSGGGDPGERFVVIATTLQRFPLGVRPFGRAARPGLKVGVIDRPKRWLMAALPLVLTGWRSGFLARHGAHQIEADAVELDLGDRFILDGEAFPAGRYVIETGPTLTFVAP